jgi:hypothetical protein
MASPARTIVSVARLALHTMSDSLLQDLERDSQTLDRNRTSFSLILHKRSFAVWSFVEELPMGAGLVCILVYACNDVN